MRHTLQKSRCLARSRWSSGCCYVRLRPAKGALREGRAAHGGYYSAALNRHRGPPCAAFARPANWIAFEPDIDHKRSKRKFKGKLRLKGE